MSAIYVLIPITLLILALAVLSFFWAVNNDQYSDLDKSARDILFERDDGIGPKPADGAHADD